MSRIRWIAPLLLFAVAAPGVAKEESPTTAKSHPLGVWTKIVGDPWHAKGEWTGGSAFEARLEAEWGPGKTNVRLRIFVPAKDGEYLRYDSVYFVHPGTKKPTYLSTSFDGETASGEFTIGKDSVTFVFPARAPMPPIRSTYRFVEKDRCRWTVEQQKDEAWSGLLDVTYARGVIAPKKRIATKPPDRKDLEPLARLVGRFDIVGTLGGHPRHVYVNRGWGLGRVIVTDYWLMDAKPPKLKERGFLWFDREKKMFREFRFVNGDAIGEGTYTVDGDTVVRDSRLWAGQDGGLFLKRFRIESPDRHTWTEVIKLTSGREHPLERDMVATREKPKEQKTNEEKEAE